MEDERNVDLLPKIKSSDVNNLLSINKNGDVIFLVLGSIIGLIFCFPAAGSCWQTVLGNGRCDGLLYTGMSQEDCCALGGASIAWTPHNDSGQLFYWRFLGGGVPECHPCRGKPVVGMYRQPSLVSLVHSFI